MPAAVHLPEGPYLCAINRVDSNCEEQCAVFSLLWSEISPRDAHPVRPLTHTLGPSLEQMRLIELIRASYCSVSSSHFSQVSSWQFTLATHCIQCSSRDYSALQWEFSNGRDCASTSDSSMSFAPFLIYALINRVCVCVLKRPKGYANTLMWTILLSSSSAFEECEGKRRTWIEWILRLKWCGLGGRVILKNQELRC